MPVLTEDLRVLQHNHAKTLKMLPLPLASREKTSRNKCEMVVWFLSWEQAGVWGNQVGDSIHRECWRLVFSYTCWLSYIYSLTTVVSKHLVAFNMLVPASHLVKPLNAIKAAAIIKLYSWTRPVIFKEIYWGRWRGLKSLFSLRGKLVLAIQVTLVTC